MPHTNLHAGCTAIRRMPDGFRWPGGRKLAVLVGVAYEAWSDGKAPGVGPMGNPLPAGHLDTNAIAWAEYGTNRGVDRLLGVLARQATKATFMVNGVLCERAGEKVRAIQRAGHDIAAHSWAMDVMPTMLTEEQERENISRTTRALAQATGESPSGWISPRGTPSVNTSRLLSEAGYAWHLDLLDEDMPAVLSFSERRLVELPAGMHVNDVPLHVRYGHPPDTFETVFDAALQAMREDGLSLTLDVIVHAHVFGRPVGAASFERVLRKLNALPDAWVATATEMAAWVSQSTKETT
jgi:peptidoglycan/xylan/chitin deacetylase (PgdA/CDA1 family)